MHVYQKRQEPLPPANGDLPMTTPIILTLDLGTTTGWALQYTDANITSGSQSFKPHRFEGGGMRYLRFKHWLTELKQKAGAIEQVYFEEVRRHNGVDAAHTYGGLLAHLTAWCEHHDIPYEGVPVGTIKRFITGKGNASKEEVLTVIRRLGYLPKDDNEADSLALLLYVLSQKIGGHHA